MRKYSIIKKNTVDVPHFVSNSEVVFSKDFENFLKTGYGETSSLWRALDRCRLKSRFLRKTDLRFTNWVESLDERPFDRRRMTDYDISTKCPPSFQVNDQYDISFNCMPKSCKNVPLVEHFELLTLVLQFKPDRMPEYVASKPSGDKTDVFSSWDLAAKFFVGVNGIRNFAHWNWSDSVNELKITYALHGSTVSSERDDSSVEQALQVLVGSGLPGEIDPGAVNRSKLGETTYKRLVDLEKRINFDKKRFSSDKNVRAPDYFEKGEFTSTDRYDSDSGELLRIDVIRGWEETESVEESKDDVILPDGSISGTIVTSDVSRTAGILKSHKTSLESKKKSKTVTRTTVFSAHEPALLPYVGERVVSDVFDKPARWFPKYSSVILEEKFNLASNYHPGTSSTTRFHEQPISSLVATLPARLFSTEGEFEQRKWAKISHPELLEPTFKTRMLWYVEGIVNNLSKKAELMDFNMQVEQLKSKSGSYYDKAHTKRSELANELQCVESNSDSEGLSEKRSSHISKVELLVAQYRKQRCLPGPEPLDVCLQPPKDHWRIWSCCRKCLRSGNNSSKGRNAVTKKLIG